MNDINKAVFFVLERNSNPNYSFTGYTDRRTGELKYIYKGKKDRNGDNLPHRFKFDKAHRAIRVYENEKDIMGTNIADFLRNYPECKESKNGDYVDEGRTQTSVWFREVKDTEDAEISIDAKKVKLNAENLALALEGADAVELAILCRIYHEDESIRKRNLLEFAGANPAVFLQYYESPERSAKALLIHAIREGEIAVRGTIYAWHGRTIGVTEDLAVSKLVSDIELMNALEEAMRDKGAGIRPRVEVVEEPVAELVEEKVDVRDNEISELKAQVEALLALNKVVVEVEEEKVEVVVEAKPKNKGGRPKKVK